MLARRTSALIELDCNSRRQLLELACGWPLCSFGEQEQLRTIRLE